MNDVARREPSLPGGTCQLSRDLQSEVMKAENPHPSVGYSPTRLPPQVVTEAHSALRLYEAACRPAEAATVRLWMAPIGACSRNPPPPEEFEFYVKQLTDVLSDLPQVVLTRQTQIDAMRTFSFWPAAADVYKFLVDDGCKIIKRRYALAEIVTSQQGM